MFRRCVGLRLLLIICVLSAAGSTTSRDLSVQPEKWRGNNYLLCRLASYEGGDLLSFSWVRLDANSTRHILTAVTRDNFHRVPLGQHFRVGDQVICEVRPALAVRHPPPRPLRSPPTRLGVTWSSRQTRDGRTDLTLTVSAPVTCRPRRNCRLLLRLQPLQGTAGTQLLLLDKCVVSFNCPGGICWPEIVTATISRAPHDGPPRPITAELRVILENRADLGPEWAEYQPPVIALTVRPSTPLICQLIDGRHVVGSDARLRTLRRAGQHVLLAGRTDGGRAQVTVSTVATRCGGRVGHSFCACAVTVDAGSEWIEVDVCPDPVDRREPTLRRSAPAGRGLQLHVLETRPDSAWLNGEAFRPKGAEMEQAHTPPPTDWRRSARQKRL
ncbi:uncharacterized protein LOC122367848 [Amphibalanus amphitrite]|uniref:uncharacterized protein LOC122367848 n=1 Tax=Amphibalanus amphitrite TaxID=1232801 RepID=UPI001C9119B8|nr:uncharacterized protein LOC122367848 [Amphibalanus amphitrite]